MAFAHVANRGTNTSKTSGTTLAVTLSGSVGVGALLFAFIAWDNNNNSTTTGPFDGQIVISDSQGNLWHQLGGAQAASTANRQHAVLYMTRVTNALSTSDTVTATHLVSARVAKAMSLEEFSMDSANLWAAVRPVHAHATAADPPSITSNGVGSDREWLFLHVLASEGPSTDSFTWDSDYTQITGAGTTGGLDDSNMTVLGGYRIVSGISSDTVDVTSDTADRDNTQLLVALTEWSEVNLGPFPQTPLLDDFNRADEDPLSFGGLWETSNACGAEGTNNFCRVSANEAAAKSGALTNSGSRWDEVFGELQEAWVTCTVAPAINTAGWFGVKMHHNGCGIPAIGSDSGVKVQWNRGDDSTNRDDTITIGDLSNAAVVSYQACVASRGIGMRWNGEQIYSCWVNNGSGWEFKSAWWRSTAFASSGRIVLGLSHPAVRVDNFGGGLPDLPFVPYMWRTDF